MSDSFRFTKVILSIFSTISFAFIILLIISLDIIISNFSLHSNVDHENLVPPLHVTTLTTTVRLDNRLIMSESFEPFETSKLARRFKSRVENFLNSKQCKVQFFMTWISPANTFCEREFFALESWFQTNPTSCLVILSSTLDTIKGHKILKPLIDHGFHVCALTPNLRDLFENTPAELWFNDIKNGSKNPGKIPLAQNLSNLMRLAVVYKYGGIYLDADLIILKDLSNIKNSIGAQSVDVNGNWTRLNNAVLIFDKNHPLVYKFIEEFALTFDGSKWGHNGPYLVSRVVDWVVKTGEDLNFTVLPRMAFYPVDWIRVGSFFAQPNDQKDAKWVDEKIQELSGSTYGVHLWNRESRGFKIEEGSIISRLISDHCVICNKTISNPNPAQMGR